jgi:preprotein translocase subunit SecE
MATKPTEFLGQVRAELKKVVWPTRAQTLRLTMVVVGVSTAVGLFIGALDVIFVKLTEIFIR